MENNIDYVTGFIRNLLPPRDELLSRIEAEAGEKMVPIVDPETARFLYWLATAHRCARVLEIGTATGYSAIWLARAVQPLGGKITTMEINKPRYDAARANLAAAGVLDMVELILGDARELLFKLTGPYDLIFLDAARGKYPQFLQHCIDMLTPGGLLVADNVFMKGMVISGVADKRRNKTAIARLRQYLVDLIDHPLLETVVLPLGDGLTVSYRKN